MLSQTLDLHIRLGCRRRWWGIDLSPVPNNFVAGRQQRRPQEQTEKTKSNGSTEHTEENQNKRQIAAPADKIGPDDVVRATDNENSPQHQKNRPSRFIGVE